MSFFKKGGGKKRKNVGVNGKGGGGKKSKTVSERLSNKDAGDDDEILSDASDVEGRPDAGYESDGLDEEAQETAEEKRLRLAKAYLEEIEAEERKRAGDDDSLHDAVNQRLKDDGLLEAGKLKKAVAEKYRTEETFDPESVRFLKDKNHKLAITCLVISPDGKHLFTASKDAGLVKWELESGAKLLKLPGGRKGMEAKHKGHCSCIHALAMSSDGKFLASGDDGRLIHIWNPKTFELLRTFRGHRDAISGLAFRKKSHTLFSSSLDRAIKIWNLDEMSYVETLFGHQDKITGIDAGIRERCVSSGGRDGSVRVWKIVEESQLVFNGPAASTDAVKLINEDHFVTAGEDGHIALWSLLKKKPLFTVSSAHGREPSNNTPYWISAIASFPMTDLVASGSNDGFIRLWKCSNDFRKLEKIREIPVRGFVNSLAFTPNGESLVAGLGQEHRLGRWWRNPEAKNCVAVIPLLSQNNSDENDDE